jgi:hypothetical protein
MSVYSIRTHSFDSDIACDPRRVLSYAKGPQSQLSVSPSIVIYAVDRTEECFFAVWTNCVLSFIVNIEASSP